MYLWNKEEKMKDLKLSERTQKDIKAAISECANELLRLMDIASVEHFKLSLDINKESTGKVIGVKFSAFTMERTEQIYDEAPAR